MIDRTWHALNYDKLWQLSNGSDDVSYLCLALVFFFTFPFHMEDQKIGRAGERDQ